MNYSQVGSSGERREAGSTAGSNQEMIGQNRCNGGLETH